MGADKDQRSHGQHLKAWRKARTQSLLSARLAEKGELWSKLPFMSFQIIASCCSLNVWVRQICLSVPSCLSALAKYFVPKSLQAFCLVDKTWLTWQGKHRERKTNQQTSLINFTVLLCFSLRATGDRDEALSITDVAKSGAAHFISYDGVRTKCCCDKMLVDMRKAIKF